MKVKLVSLRALRRASLPVACSVFFLAAASAAPGQENPPATEPPPAVTVPTPQPEPAPDPDPAPVEQPPKEQPVPSSPAPAPTSSPPVSTPPADTGPTPQEIAAQKKEELEKAKAAELERARKEAAQLAKAREKSIQGGFSAFLDVIASASLIAVPALPEPEPEPAATATPEAPVDVEPASQPVAAPFTAPGSPASSSLSGAGPVLLGLLGLAVMLLGLAALPPWTVRSPVIGGLLAQRRLEIGLIGTAVLASAAIGLAIAVAAG